MTETFIERPRKNEKDSAIQYVKSLLSQAREDNRNEDIEKLEELIRLLHTKKYGLVWEEHAEIVEEEMKTKIPVFVESEERKIVGNPLSSDYNFLLEGDNLHSLHLLEKTHVGNIDVIYIDPPYNTGNNDFVYNDKIVDKTDGYSHSKWLSFMSKRLDVARRLLSDTGVIFISIDDNEQAQLKLLCDEIFGEKNFIANFIWQKRTSPDARKIVSEAHEYIICYSKSENSVNDIFNLLPLDESDKKGYKNLDNDPRGPWRSTDFGAQGWRPNQMYTIVTPAGVEYSPSEGRCWKNIETKYLELLEDGRMWFGKDGKGVPRKKVYLSEKLGKNTWTWWSNQEVGNTQEGTKEIKEIFGTKTIFDYPKPTRLLSRILKISSKKDTTILDFFAGSGTTGHAVVQLNKEDGGNRKYILCTNNESMIAEEVTYKRMSTIQEDLPHNLKYFKTDFVDKSKFPDFTLESELLKYITPLVELEFGVDISNPYVQVILTEEHLEKLLADDKLEVGATLFIHPDVFLDSKEQEKLTALNIKLQEIPDYFFGKELWS